MRKLLALLAFSTLTVGVASAEPGTGAAPGSKVASHHWANIEAQAVQIRHSSDLLESFVRNPEISWEAHVDELVRVRRSVRSMARSYLAARESQNLSTEQRQALVRVGRTLNLMGARSGDALSAVAHKPAKPMLLDEQYVENLETLGSHAAALARLSFGGPTATVSALPEAGI